MEIAVAPCDRRRLSLAKSAERQKADKIRATMVPASIGFFNCFNQCQKLALARQLKPFRKHTKTLDEPGGIVVTRTGLDSYFQNQAQRADRVVKV